MVTDWNKRYGADKFRGRIKDYVEVDGVNMIEKLIDLNQMSSAFQQEAIRREL